MHQTRHLGLTIFISFLSLVFILSAVTLIAPLRESAIRMLSRYDSDSRFYLTAAVADASNTPIVSSDNPAPVPEPPPTYEYKIIRNVDPCTFNKLGSQSFQAVQFGSNLDSQAGLDENCKSSRGVNILDWVLFQRIK